VLHPQSGVIFLCDLKISFLLKVRSLHSLVVKTVSLMALPRWRVFRFRRDWLWMLTTTLSLLITTTIAFDISIAALVFVMLLGI
jgi:hypothetical protein